MLNSFTNKRANKNLGLIMSLSLLGLFLAFFIFQFNLLFALLAFLLYTVFVFSFFYPLPGILIFIILRPLLDIFTNNSVFSVAGLEVNLASLAGVMVIVLSLYFFFGLGFKKVKTRGLNLKLFWLWAIFLTINILSALVTVYLAGSAREIIRLLSIFSLFILGSVLANSASDLTKVLKAVLISALIPALLGIFHLIYQGQMFIDQDGRLLATFAHPNMLAFYLFFTIAVSLFVFLYGFKKNILSYFYAFLGLLFFIPLVLTYTRGAWLALIIFLIIIGIFKFRKILLVSVLFFALMYLSMPSLYYRVNNAFAINNYDSSIAWRLQLYQDSWAYAQDKPVLGYGAGNANVVISENRSPYLGSSEPHNDYLKTLLETGYVGLISYLALLAVLVYELFKKYKEVRVVRIKYFNFFMIAVVISLAITSFGDNILNDTALQWSLWLVLGGFLSLNSQKKMEKEIDL
ncbi:MAG: O-antigen ligase family protein [Candidatus Pacebacteria bacterium]|nr:O-antigen ligase family protein [Candidatus Paceibacterota bacterium]